MQKYNLLHNLFLTEKTSDKSSYEEKIHIQSMKIMIILCQINLTRVPQDLRYVWHYEVT